LIYQDLHKGFVNFVLFIVQRKKDTFNSKRVLVASHDKTKNMKKLSVLFVAILSFTLSFGQVNVDDQFNQLMELSSGGIFRGASFDMAKSDVLDIENSRNTTSVYKDEEDTELVITTDMGADIMNFADVTYTFDEQGLYHIGVESYAVSKSSADRVFDMVKSYYTNKLGTPTLAEDGFYEFYGKYSGYDYVIAIYNLEYEDSPGMEMYIYIN
jgi:hypothetical protein